jgi:hypothetical protein
VWCDEGLFATALQWVPLQAAQRLLQRAAQVLANEERANAAAVEGVLLRLRGHMECKALRAGNLDNIGVAVRLDRLGQLCPRGHKPQRTRN